MIKENVLNIKDKIQQVCAKIRRNPQDIKIVAVSKDRSLEEIIEVVEAGIFDLGENRLQEALLKYNKLAAKGYPLNAIKWHMVGHLQTNKVKEAVRIFDLIHSVDSLRLAEAIDRCAGRINKIQDILIEVNTSAEKTKFGLRPEEVIDTLKKLVKFKNINIKGLMTIAPQVDLPEKTRPYFKMLRQLYDEIKNLGLGIGSWEFLSMGMTDDFTVAIEEGANLLRLGRAIFGG